MTDLEKVFADIEALLERMIDQQRNKVTEVARDILTHLAPEEIQNPQDYPEVTADAMFNFEDGLLAGLMSARVALRNNIFAAHRTPTA